MNPKQPKAIQNYLEVMDKMTRIEQTPIFWWTKLDEQEFMKTMQKFCWENSIDFNMINWGKFLRGEHVPQSWENE
jgi:hypothetical protein